MRAPRILALLVTALLAVGLLTALGSPTRAEQATSAAKRVAAASIDVNSLHSCAVTVANRVRCWGHGGNGKLGYVDTEDVGDDETPASAGDVTVGGKVSAIATGTYHSCALLVTEKVRCWGFPGSGRLGYGTFTGTVGDDETPASVGDVPVGGKVVAITAGEEHTCALLRSGAVRCWGNGADFRLGYPSEDNVGESNTPAEVGNVLLGGKATAISAGEEHTCALMTTRAVRCWGESTDGRLGYGPQFTDLTPTPDERGDVPLGGPAVAISAGHQHTCALLAGGAMRCWGSGGDGRLGYGSTNTIGDNETTASAGDVPVGGKAVAVTAGHDVTCAVLATGAPRCWGRGSQGRLGNDAPEDMGDDEPASASAKVDLEGAKAAAISTGFNHTCIVLTTGGIRCWGIGTYGELGHGGGITFVSNPADFPNLPVGAKVRARVKPKVSLRAKPARDRSAPYVYRLRGSVSGPFVVDAATCRAKVKVTVRRGAKVVARTTTAVSSACAFQAKVRVKGSALGSGGRTKLRITATYVGNGSLAPAQGKRSVYAR